MALTAEEKTILDNVKTLLEEIYSMEAGEAGDVAEGMGEPDEENPDTETDEMEKITKTTPVEEVEGEPKKPEVNKKCKKELVTAKPDGSTASSDAEDKIEDLPEPTEEGVKEVAKQLARLLGLTSPNPVRKSQGGNRALITALTGLTQVVKSMTSRQKQTEATISDLLTGLGVSKEIEGAYGVAKSKTAGTVKKVQKAIDEISTETEAVTMRDVRNDVRKNLANFFK